MAVVLRATTPVFTAAKYEELTKKRDFLVHRNVNAGQHELEPDVRVPLCVVECWHYE